MASKTYLQIGVMGLYTETPLHCGADSGAGYVDLPVQRERHTNYPVIPGSTLKGIFADEIDDPTIFRNRQNADAAKPAPGDGDQKRPFVPDLVSFLDGLIVAFPVRSSEAPFHWVTCPFVLERVLRALGHSCDIESPEGGRAWAARSGRVLLEEMRLERDARPELFDTAEGRTAKLETLLDLIPDGDTFRYTRGIFLDRLLVVTDEDFRELVTIGTSVATRIKLTGLGTTTDIPKGQNLEFEGDERKGNMFVEETVPPETLFLAPLRSPNGPDDPFPWEKVPSLVRIGGGETIGHGITHVTCLKESRLEAQGV